jgi:hypothetical protein
MDYLTTPRIGKFEDWAEGEFRRVERAANAPVSVIQLNPLHAEPTKLAKGMIVYADGTDWEPNGSGGEGVYFYNGSAWVPMF